MTEQPEALRLADVPISQRNLEWQSNATAELRRLHSENERLSEVVTQALEPVAWMVYAQDGQSVYVTDNPIEIGDAHKALPLYTSSLSVDLRAEVERLRGERDHSRARFERASALIHGIHALLYPPHVTLPDGRAMAFRPSSLDPHEVLQELSNRIRALPDELDALKEPK